MKKKSKVKFCCRTRIQILIQQWADLRTSSIDIILLNQIRLWALEIAHVIWLIEYRWVWFESLMFNPLHLSRIFKTSSCPHSSVFEFLWVYATSFFWWWLILRWILNHEGNWISFWIEGVSSFDLNAEDNSPLAVEGSMLVDNISKHHFYYFVLFLCSVDPEMMYQEVCLEVNHSHTICCCMPMEY